MSCVTFMSTFDVPANASAIQHERYTQPSWNELADDEPRRGCCFNCDHRTRVTIGGEHVDLCVAERDNGGSGEVWTCDPDETECVDWHWDGDEL